VNFSPNQAESRAPSVIEKEQNQGMWRIFFKKRWLLRITNICLFGHFRLHNIVRVSAEGPAPKA
jgi:hypothetical protein